MSKIISVLTRFRGSVYSCHEQDEPPDADRSLQCFNNIYTGNNNIANSVLPMPAHMSNKEIIQTLSPLALFVFHVLYLAFLSHEPFLTKWIDGSFTFFVALVMCNIIRARIVAAADVRDRSENTHHDDDDPEGGSTP